MDILINPLRGRDGAMAALDGVPMPVTDVSRARALLRRCPKFAATPLLEAPDLARNCGVGAISVKDERARMGLGSFKGLGAVYAIAEDAAADCARGETYVAASAGNHGMSVATGARAFGAHAVIYIANSVSERFAARLRDQGARVIRKGDTYEASMAAAVSAAQTNGWQLLSDSSWPGYFQRPLRVMQGYLVLMAEIQGQIAAPPSHVFVQAGVGGLAAAVSVMVRQYWGDEPRIVVVEPAAAPALKASIAAGRPVVVKGSQTAMARLDCKEPSLIALHGLARDADVFCAISEDEGREGADVAGLFDLATTASGAAGLAGLLAGAAHREALGLDGDSRVLLILSEEPHG